MTTHRIPLRPSTSPPPEVLPRYRRKLTSLRQYRSEINRVYRAMEAGTLRSQEGTRRVYVLRQGADLTREIEELNELRRLNAQLAALRDGTSTNTSPLLGHTIEGTFAPAQEEPT